jgi:3-mercaptopyruvate sulfurtransferase SseA
MRSSFGSRLLINSLLSAALLSGAMFSCSESDDDGSTGGEEGKLPPPKGGTGGTDGGGGEAGAGEAGGTTGKGGSAGKGGTTGEAGFGGSESEGEKPGAGGEGGLGGDGLGGSGADAGAGGDGPSEPNALPAASPTDLATESADDYADNEHGIITGDRLKLWVEDWETNRPEGVTGKLVVLQVVPNAANSLAHVAGNGTDVVSYLVPSSELTQVRDNGLSRIEAEIPDGPSADAFLKKYGIDAVNDYVVLTFEQLGSTQNSIVQSVGRAWLYLRYWGYGKERLALLNGSINWNATQHGLVTTADVTAPPDNGTTSVKDLLIDNTNLVISLGGLLDIFHDKPSAEPRSNVSIVDARGGAEALGLRKATSTGKTDCYSYTGTGNNTRCSPPFEGRLRGANSVPWAQFIDTSANGFQLLSKAAVKTIFDDQADYEPGQLTIQYCRTNQRSMVTGIVASVILGYPTRFYDTSFIEWSHLAYGPTPLTRVLPPNSSFRTDLLALTEHADVTGYTPGGSIEGITINGWVDGPNYNADVDISLTPPLVTPESTTASLSIKTDKAYKLE